MRTIAEPNQEAQAEASHQVERILNSATMRHSEALRQLLRYLFDKTLSGDAEDLKEYTIGVEGLGKRAAYDPRYESAVRTQLLRLRQKLIEYYHSEGRDDAVLIELPRGQFKLAFESREVEAVGAKQPKIGEIAAPAPPQSHSNYVLASLLLLALIWGGYTTVVLWNLQRQTALFRDAWPPELDNLWRPFLMDRPLILAIEDPPFAKISGFGYYSDRTSTNWDELMQSSATSLLRNKYDASEFQPDFFFTGTAEASAAFTLGKLIGFRVPHLSLARSSELSWQQFANNNMILMGESRFFKDWLRGLPVEAEFLQNEGEIEILHPRSGDPPIPTLVHGNVRGTGQQYALVSTLPGPSGKGFVQAFTSTGTSARLAALQMYMDPAQARALSALLAGPSGTLPQYYQVVLKVSYTDGVPTNVEYVFHRELHLKVPGR